MKNKGKQDFFHELSNYTILLKAVAYILEHKYNMPFFSKKLEMQMQHLLYINERIDQYMQSEGDFPVEICCERSKGLKALRQKLPFRSGWSASLPIEWLQSDRETAEGHSILSYPQFRRVFYSWYPAAPFINTELGVTKIIESKEN